MGTGSRSESGRFRRKFCRCSRAHCIPRCTVWRSAAGSKRSEEHTSELQSRVDLVCRLLLEKKNNLPNSGTNSDSSIAIEGRKSDDKNTGPAEEFQQVSPSF